MWLAQLFNGLDEFEADWAADLATRLILVHASGLHRRVIEQCSSFPLLLLKLVASQPSFKCDDRARVASLILETPEKALEANALKLRKLYPQHLKVAAATGLLPPELWYVLSGVRSMFKSDVREMERINKIIKLQEERAPRITTDLLSARVGLKHFLGEGGEGKGLQRTKWSTFKVVAQKLQNTCVSCWDSKSDILMNETRFTPPHTRDVFATTEPLSSTALNKIFHKLKGRSPTINNKIPQVAYTWAASYNMLWQKKAREMIQSSELYQLPIMCLAKRMCGKRTSEFAYYVVADKVRTSLHMASCSFDKVRKRLELVRPLQFTWSLDVLAQCYPIVSGGGRVGLFAIPVALFGCVAEKRKGSSVNEHAERLLHAADANGIAFQKVLELKKPSKAMTEKLEKISGAEEMNAASSGEPCTDSAQKDADVSASASCSSGPSSAEVETQPRQDSENTGCDDERADADIQEGLNCLLEESEASGDMPESGDGAGADNVDIDSTMLDAQNLFHDLMADTLRDDSEKFNNVFAEQCESEMAENMVSRVEQAIASSAVDNGVNADQDDVQRMLLQGASEEDAILESVLNSEEALGNGGSCLSGGVADEDSLSLRHLLNMNM